MKIKKIDLNRFNIANEGLNKIFGGAPNYGELRVTYSGGSANDFGSPSTDRITEQYQFMWDLNGNPSGTWCEIGRNTIQDVVSR